MRRVHLIAALHVALLLAGCLDRSRLNASCQWIGDTPSAALDMALAADRRHLANDVRMAGENATRYRDSVKVNVGFAAAGRLDVECLDRLYATIGAQHRVGRVEIEGLGASAVATAVAYLHSWNVETVRLRDFHISFRAAYLPIGRHPWLSLLAAMTVFAIAGLYEYRAARKRPADHSRRVFLGRWQH